MYLQQPLTEQPYPGDYTAYAATLPQVPVSPTPPQEVEKKKRARKQAEGLKKQAMRDALNRAGQPVPPSLEKEEDETEDKYKRTEAGRVPEKDDDYDDDEEERRPRDRASREAEKEKKRAEKERRKEEVRQLKEKAMKDAVEKVEKNKREEGSKERRASKK